MSKRAEKTVTIGGHEIEIRTLPNFPNALSVGYPYGPSPLQGIAGYIMQNENMKTNFPIGAEVYVRDGSYAKNLSGVKCERIHDRAKCRVLTTPFKAMAMNIFNNENTEYEFVLVQPIDSSEVYQVLNNLADANKIRVQLNDYHIAELSPEHPGYIKVGCQKISFEKVKELYEVIFRERRPEPVDESRMKMGMLAGLRMDWERQRYGFPSYLTNP